MSFDDRANFPIKTELPRTKPRPISLDEAAQMFGSTEKALSGPEENTFVSDIFKMTFNDIKIFKAADDGDADTVDDDMRKRFEETKRQYNDFHTRLAEFESANFVMVMPSSPSRFDNIVTFYNIGGFQEFSIEGERADGDQVVEPATAPIRSDSKPSRRKHPDVAKEGSKGRPVSGASNREPSTTACLCCGKAILKQPHKCRPKRFVP